MSKSHKIILGGLVGLLVLIALALLLFVDANAYKPRFEAAASGALGMEVRVGGRMGVGFFPSLSVTLKDVHISNHGEDIVSVKEARLGIDLLPLFHKEVRLGKLALKHPSFSIERDSDGKYNFDNSEAGRGTLPALNLGEVSLSDGTLNYADKQSGEGFEAGDCKLDVRSLRLAEAKSSDFMKSLSFTGELACGEIRTKDFTVSDLMFSVAGKDGVFDFKPVMMRVFGGQGSGTIRADFSGPVPLYHIHYSLPQFRIEEFYKTLSQQKVVEGAMDFSADLSMQGKTVNEMTQTANGEASLRGENLTLNGTDLDQEFSRYESSQHFNLVDLGAVLLGGPVGLVVTKGYNFASILKGSGSASTIRTLVSEWKIDRGVAHAQDVAMATNKNRIALRGGLDFANGRFDDVTVVLIDAKGCAKVKQKISGPFQKPVVDKPNILVTLAGPALKLLKKGMKLFSGGACEVIYTGSVAPPK
ncbi:MAG: AsmA family protein [Gallionella sp.]